MASEESINELETQELDHSGGGRFNRKLMVGVIALAMIGGVALVAGVQTSGLGAGGTKQKLIDDPNAAARNHSEVEDLAAHGAVPHPAPTVFALPPVVQTVQAPAARPTPKQPSRYAEWVQQKYMKALEAPEMVAAFHQGGTFEIPTVKGQTGANVTLVSSTDPSVTLHPPASPYTVMAGSVVPAVLISGINSDLPGPILAQVSENVFDSATGKSLLVPQGSRLIGVYQAASSFGQQRVRIAWQRLIFPDTSSMDLPKMPGADQAGFTGFNDEVNNHYLATFGTAAVMSLISAGQMVGQMAAFGGGGAVYGPLGTYQPNQWAMAGESAGSGASGEFGSVGQQMIAANLSRPPTLEIRPGYQFNVMVTEDLVFPAPYRS
ncbi:MAG: TrbI/VirB10 family protein [Candidatus Binataceae bacterium]